MTGGYAGVGLELCKILYARNATVHIAGRSAAKAEAAITDILAANPFSTGKLAFLQLDLSDLATIKPAVERFTAANTRLDVLVNNAGVMFPPAGSVDAQGHDLQVGTNCLGPYLLYQLLLPLLTRTAASSPTATVRVAWAASIAAQLALPSSSGMVLDGEGQPMEQGIEVMYAQTKVGNVFFAREFAKDTEANGVVHVAFNPGNLATELSRHWSGIVPWLVVSALRQRISDVFDLSLRLIHDATGRISSLHILLFLEGIPSCGLPCRLRSRLLGAAHMCIPGADLAVFRMVLRRGCSRRRRVARELPLLF